MLIPRGDSSVNKAAAAGEHSGPRLAMGCLCAALAGEGVGPRRTGRGSEQFEGILAQRPTRGEATLGSVILKLTTRAKTFYFASVASTVGFSHAAILA